MEPAPECRYPARWRVRSYPGPEQIAALGEPV
jgi:hypothetical protein